MDNLAQQLYDLGVEVFYLFLMCGNCCCCSPCVKKKF